MQGDGGEKRDQKKRAVTDWRTGSAKEKRFSVISSVLQEATFSPVGREDLLSQRATEVQGKGRVGPGGGGG